MWLYRTLRAVAPPLRRYWRATVSGAERVPAQGPLLVAANHASYLDPFLIGGLFPRVPIRWLINERWFRRSPLWTAAFRGCAVIEVLERDPARTVERVVAALGRGEVVGIFPEGRISADGRIGPGRPGLGRIAARTGVPVVPCGLRGAHASLPRHRHLPRRVPIRLLIGEPVLFPGAPTDSPERAEVGRFVDGVMARVAGLAGERPSPPGTRIPRSVPSAAAAPGSGGSPGGWW